MKSRKLWVLILSAMVMVALPIVYKHMDISNDLTLIVLIAVAGSSSIYTGANVLSKKYRLNG